jgi:hypothetical protein
MSSNKEPEVLIKLPEPREATAYYERLFPDNPAHQRRGEASTRYSQLTLFPGRPERAKNLLGSDVRALGPRGHMTGRIHFLTCAAILTLTAGVARAQSTSTCTFDQGSRRSRSR